MNAPRAVAHLYVALGALSSVVDECGSCMREGKETKDGYLQGPCVVSEYTSSGCPSCNARKKLAEVIDTLEHLPWTIRAKDSVDPTGAR